MNKIVAIFIFMFVVLIIALCGSVISGGYAALRYSGLGIEYLKWDTFFEVISTFKGQAQHKNLVLVAVAGFVAPIVMYLLFVLVVVVGMLPKKVIYGNARLATDIDLSKSTFFPTDKERQESKVYTYPPILIGKQFKGRYKGKYIYFHGQQFLILYAPTRSGKGVGIVIPNCINYPHSMVVLDIKLENWFLSAGYRKVILGQECFLFAPAGYADNQEEAKKGFIKSHRWNPLDCVGRSDIQRSGDLEKIAAMLIPSSDDPIWSDSARKLFCGLALYLLDKERYHLVQKKKGVTGVPDVLVSMSAVMKLSVPESGQKLSTWMGSEIDQRSYLSDETKSLFREFMSAPDKTQGCIITNFSSPLSIFRNPITAAATDYSDFDIRQVRKKPMSIYLGLTPDALITHSKLVNLFFSMFVNENTKELPEQNPELKYQCMVLLDEFTSMGKSEIIEKGVGFTAGFNIRFVVILQNEGQGKKDDMYGIHGWETFVENSAVIIYYPPKVKNELAKKISEEIGVMDMKVTKKSDSSGGGKGGRSKSRSFDTLERAVLLPEEIVALRDEKNKTKNMAIREIVVSEYTRPFIANKIIWFEEKIFKERVDIAKKNPVSMPVLFDEEMRKKILEQASIYSDDESFLSDVMNKPDLENHDTEDMSA